MTNLYLREHKVKNAMACKRELVGVLKSRKQQLQLAEFRENKWTLKNSNLSISGCTDGSMLNLKGDNQLVSLSQAQFTVITTLYLSSKLKVLVLV